MTWPANDTIWHDICAGSLCCLCEAALSVPPLPGFRYCVPCVPTPADTPHRVMVCIDHHTGGWSVCFHSEEAPPFTLWLVNVTDKHLERIISRSRMCPYDRARHPQALRAWGRNSFHSHMSAAQHHKLRRAWQSDPRNGYEKLNHLPAVRRDR